MSISQSLKQLEKACEKRDELLADPEIVQRMVLALLEEVKDLKIQLKEARDLAEKYRPTGQ